MNPATFAVQGPLPPTQCVDELNAFAGEGDGVSGTYQHFRSGHDPEVFCYHLVNTSDQSTVGFVGIKHHAEDLSPQINAFVSVELVFLRPQYRGLGLSRIIRARLMEHISDWLSRVVRDHPPHSEITVRSASSIKTNAGKRFALGFELALATLCEEIGLEFASCIV